MTPQELKYSILGDAFTGKLCEHIESKDFGGIKAIELLETPFDVPETWVWSSLGLCCEMYTGNSISETVKTAKYAGLKTGYDYIATKDVTFDQEICYDNGVRIPHDEGFKVAYKDAVLMCIESGSAGRKIGILDRDVCFGNKLCSFHSQEIDNKYLFYYLQSWLFKEQFSGNMTGIIGGVSIRKLKEIAIPIAPLVEQKHIVSKIEELLPYIDHYEQAWSRLEDFNKHFPVDIQKSILQMAIQGKLVEQRPEEGTGEELYQQIHKEKQKLIKAGKIKKDKPFPEIAEDEKQFNIPDSWKWVRLQTASVVIVDCPHSTPKYLEYESGYYSIGTKCMNGKGEITQLFNVSKEEYCQRIDRLVPEKDDIVYSREGSIICRAVLLPSDKRICLGQRVMLIRCSDTLYPKYIQHYLMADSTIAFLTQNYKGVGVKHINVADVCALPVPLPPLVEQKRIVAKLEALLPLCEKLK